MIFIFTENFYLTGGICLTALFVLVAKRFFTPKISYRVAVACWLFLVIGGGAAAMIAILNLPHQGTDESQLAILVFIFGASPLMVSGAIALFLFPRKTEKPIV
jgi:hypothetical protein